MIVSLSLQADGEDDNDDTIFNFSQHLVAFSSSLWLKMSSHVSSLSEWIEF